MNWRHAAEGHAQDMSGGTVAFEGSVGKRGGTTVNAKFSIGAMVDTVGFDSERCPGIVVSRS